MPHIQGASANTCGTSMGYLLSQHPKAMLSPVSAYLTLNFLPLTPTPVFVVADPIVLLVIRAPLLSRALFYSTTTTRAMTSPSPPHYASVVGSASGSASSSGILQHPNANGSQYTLATLNNLCKGPASLSSRSASPNSRRSTDSDREPLLRVDPTVSSHNYGATMPMSPNGNISSRRILLNACVKMAALFIVSTALLGGTLWLALPPLESLVAVYLSNFFRILISQ